MANSKVSDLSTVSPLTTTDIVYAIDVNDPNPLARSKKTTVAAINGLVPNVTTSSNGLMLQGDKSKLDASTSAATGSTLVQRDSGGAASFTGLTAGQVTITSSPSAPTDAATKSYVDASSSGLVVKDPCVAATTANITLTGGAPSVLDGVTLASGNRVLVKNQSDQKQNGIYSVTTLGSGSNGTWTRSTDADTGSELPAGSYVFVSGGTVNASSGWTMVTPDPIVIGTSNIVWSLFSQTSSIAAANITGQLTAAQIADAQLTTAKFAASIRPVELFASLPAFGNQGRVVFNTTDNKLYRDTGSGWTNLTPTTDLSGQIITAQIADAAILTAKLADNAVATAKLADLSVIGTKLADGSVATGKLADGSVTSIKILDANVLTSKLADNAVTTAKVADGSILNAKLANLAVDLSKLAANSVDGTKIVAGAVTASKIAADTITANEIAAGAITSSELASNSVIAGKIAAGTITATEIAANTITANNIAAGAISASKLLVTSNDLVSDPNFQDDSVWFASDGVGSGAIGATGMGWFHETKATGSSFLAGQVVASVSSARGGWVTTRLQDILQSPGHYVSCKPSTVYEASLGVDNQSNQSLSLIMSALDSTQSFITNFTATSAASSGGSIIRVQFTTGSTTQFFRPVVSTSGVGTFTGVVSVNNFSFREAGTSTSIVDGAISTNKIAANAITTAKLAAGSVTATELAAGSVIAGKISAASITATEIAAATITGGNLVANTISSNELATDSVIAGKIAAGAVNTTELAAGAITTAKIAAGAVIASHISVTDLSAINSDMGAITAGSLSLSTTGKALSMDANGIQLGTNSIFISSNNNSAAVIAGVGVSSVILSGLAGVGNIGFAGGSYSISGSGDASLHDVTVHGTFSNPSSIKLKKDVSPLIDALDVINSFRPVNFRWKSDNREDFGLIAEEVEKIIPDLVVTSIEGNKSVQYLKLITHLIGAVQELSARIDELEEKS